MSARFRYTNILLTNEESVKAKTGLDQNISGAFLLPALKTAQDTDLEQTIGTRLLRHLCELVGTGDIALAKNEVYKYLLDEHVSYFLAFATIAKVMPIVAFKVNNAGVTRTDDDKMSGVSKTDINALRDFYQSEADTYKDKMQRFILSEMSAFSKYMSQENISGMRANLYASDSSPIFLGGARGKRVYGGFNPYELPNPIE